MKSTLLALPMVLVAGIAFAGVAPAPTTTTKTDPTLFLGLSWTFGKGGSGASATPGITLKALSTNKRKSGALAAGVTYNFDGSFGCDLGVGFNSSGSATVTAGWDLCKGAPQFSLGASGKPKTTTTTTASPTATALVE